MQQTDGCVGLSRCSVLNAEEKALQCTWVQRSLVHRPTPVGAPDNSPNHDAATPSCNQDALHCKSTVDDAATFAANQIALHSGCSCEIGGNIYKDCLTILMLSVRCTTTRMFCANRVDFMLMEADSNNDAAPLAATTALV